MEGHHLSHPLLKKGQERKAVIFRASFFDISLHCLWKRLQTGMGRLSFFPFKTVQREGESNEETLGNPTVFIVSTIFFELAI